MNFAKFLRTPFLQNASGRLLLYFVYCINICFIILQFIFYNHNVTQSSQVQWNLSIQEQPPEVFFKKGTPAQVFSCEFYEISKNTFLQNTSIRLLLSIVITIGTSKQYPLQRGVRYIETLPKLAYLPSKTCSRVLGYRTIDPKVCQEAGVGRRKSLKTINQRVSRVSVFSLPKSLRVLIKACIKIVARAIYTQLFFSFTCTPALLENKL